MHRFVRLSAAAAAAVLLAACQSTKTGGPVDLPASDAVSAETTEPGCAPKVEPPHKWANRPYTVLGERYTPVTGDKPMRQRGIASWYGKQFHGKKTSNGEIFDMYSVSAAHKTMELPSYARVTNLGNGKSIIVRVNDRGPFYGGRVIDLSYEAARRLGYAVKGTAQVEVERITMSEIASGNWKTSLASSDIPADQSRQPETKTQSIASETRTSGWAVQTGAFSSPENARTWAAHTEAMLSSEGVTGGSTRIVRSSDGLCRVMSGSGLTHEAASDLAQQITRITGQRAFPAQK